MALIIDAGALYAQADRAEPRHKQVVDLLKSEKGPLVTSQSVAAEADYLILKRLGLQTEMAFLKDLAEGTYLADCLTQPELKMAYEIGRKYRDLKLGISDCSLVVLAKRYKTRRILTFDEKAFRPVSPLQGGVFTVLPADRDRPHSETALNADQKGAPTRHSTSA